MTVRLVLWGGRPGRDVWVGSPEDRLRHATTVRVADARGFAPGATVSVGGASFSTVVRVDDELITLRPGTGLVRGQR